MLRKTKMKKISILLLALFFCIQTGFSRPIGEYTQEELQVKQRKFTKMKTTGIIMGLIGTGMFIGGIVMASNGEWETTTDNFGNQQTNAKDGLAAGGLVTLVVGLPLGVTGWILTGIGAKKEAQYKALLQDVSLRLEYHENRKGIRLSFAY